MCILIKTVTNKERKIAGSHLGNIVHHIVSRVGQSVSGYGLDDRAIEVRSPAEAKGFFL
jgi:hypothetical protein